MGMLVFTHSSQDEGHAMLQEATWGSSREGQEAERAGRTWREPLL